jgi:hypothetical protein
MLLFQMTGAGIVGLLLGLLLIKLWRPDGQLKSFIEYVLGLSREQQLLSLTVFGIAIAVASNLLLIGLVVFAKVIDPVVIALVATFNGAVTQNMIGTTYNFWYGSSNGSQRKDENK